MLVENRLQLVHPDFVFFFLEKMSIPIFFQLKQDIDKHKQTLIKLYLIFSINHEMGSFEIEIILF